MLAYQVPEAAGPVTHGDFVLVAARGAYTGEPRPVLIVRSDAYNSPGAIRMSYRTSRRWLDLQVE